MKLVFSFVTVRFVVGLKSKKESFCLIKGSIMKKIGLIILGIIILGAILVLTLVMEIIEFFMGAIFFVFAIVVLIYLYNKIKDKIS